MSPIAILKVKSKLNWLPTPLVQRHVGSLRQVPAPVLQPLQHPAHHYLDAVGCVRDTVDYDERLGVRRFMRGEVMPVVGQKAQVRGSSHSEGEASAATELREFQRRTSILGAAKSPDGVPLVVRAQHVVGQLARVLPPYIRPRVAGPVKQEEESSVPPRPLRLLRTGDSQRDGCQPSCPSHSKYIDEGERCTGAGVPRLSPVGSHLLVGF